MATSCSSYEGIKSELLFQYNNSCTKAQLRAITDTFKEVIRSTRQVDNVSSVQELVRLLEKRCILNQQEFSSLDIIANALGSNITKLRAAWNIRTEATTTACTPIEVRSSLPNYRPQASVLPVHPATAHERIYNLVIDEIGIKWKELARNLGISEGKIDELEERHRYLPSERVREILTHNEVTSSSRWTYKLMDALFKSRRADLRNKVQNILIDNF